MKSFTERRLAMMSQLARQFDAQDEDYDERFQWQAVINDLNKLKKMLASIESVVKQIHDTAMVYDYYGEPFFKYYKQMVKETDEMLREEMAKPKRK